ncbi:MAG: hypothetical protein H0V30_07675 [Chitinophagaceae bacterium]|jgi:hypothetical protein|nr:hypothetical protein [Chitinophagaceae bacterium]
MELDIEMIKACRMTALSCRQCVSVISVEEPIVGVYLRSFKQCEDICFAFLQAAADNSVYLGKIAFLCIGLLEECAEIAEYKNDKIFLQTASSCRDFSGRLTQLLSLEKIGVTI